MGLEDDIRDPITEKFFYTIAPFFKFMKKKYADKMLDEGEVHLPDIYSFRKEEGLLGDNEEAIIYKKLPRWYLPKYGKSNLENILCYCMNGYLITSSLKCLKEDKKESCIMIIDGRNFFRFN